MRCFIAVRVQYAMIIMIGFLFHYTDTLLLKVSQCRINFHDSYVSSTGLFLFIGLLNIFRHMRLSTQVGDGAEPLGVSFICPACTLLKPFSNQHRE